VSISPNSLRLVGYVRVSDVAGRSGASFISPAIQWERIAAWCSLYNARLQDVLEELDESGGRADRPLLMQAIQRVETGLSDGIIVAKLDRFGRSFKDALEHIERIDRAGGRLISVQDQFAPDLHRGAHRGDGSRSHQRPRRMAAAPALPGGIEGRPASRPPARR
jgi:DNA invertase Pin-like site-specific DNA recombinase